MASVFKRGRWLDANGRKCTKDRPGAKYVESRFNAVSYTVNGQTKRVKAYTDRIASEQLASRLEKAKAHGAQGLEDPFKVHWQRKLSDHVAEWTAELKEAGRDDVIYRTVSNATWPTHSGMPMDDFYRDYA